jgi:hypothetical protein
MGGNHTVFTVAAAVTLLAGLGSGAAATPSTAGCRAGLGQVAFSGPDASLRVARLGTCHVQVLVRQGLARGPVASADGRLLAYAVYGVDATGKVGLTVRVTPLSGDFTRTLLPKHTSGEFSWAPSGHTLAVTTLEGGLALVDADTGAARRVLPDGFGAGGSLFTPDGRTLVVERRRDLWRVDVQSGTRAVIWRLRSGVAPPKLASMAPDGRSVLFWTVTQNSSSLAADGLPLYRLDLGSSHRVTSLGTTLATPDVIAWCGGRLVLSFGGDRYSTHGKTLVRAGASRTRIDRDGSRSWVSPSCSPGTSRIAVAAGRNYYEPRFGREHRSIWLLGADGRTRARLTSPPAGATDEDPRLSADGRTVLFVRVARGDATLRVVDVRRRAVSGPLAQLGAASGFYGTYDFDEVSAWIPG